MKTNLNNPMKYRKTLKLRFRVGDLDLPGKKKRYTISREEGGEDAQMRPCSKAIREVRTQQNVKCRRRHGMC